MRRRETRFALRSEIIFRVFRLETVQVYRRGDDHPGDGFETRENWLRWELRRVTLRPTLSRPDVRPKQPTHSLTTPEPDANHIHLFCRMRSYHCQSPLQIFRSTSSVPSPSAP